MGYRPVKKVYNISYEDYPGLILKAVSAPLGKLFEISNMRVEVIQEDEAKRMLVFDEFAKRIVEWNIEHPEIEDSATATVAMGTATEMEALVKRLEMGVCARCGLAEGELLPANGSAMLCLDLDFVVSLLMGWIEATSRVSVPKDLNSNAGGSNTREEATDRLAAMQSPLTLPMLS